MFTHVWGHWQIEKELWEIKKKKTKKNIKTYKIIDFLLPLKIQVRASSVSS